MGYRGKVAEQAEARALRSEGRTLQEIADRLGVSRGSVSLWVRDVAFEPRPRSPARRRGPNVLQRRKAEEIERLLAEGRERIGCLSEREFLVAGTALYAGEGFKTPGAVGMANSDPRMIAFFCAWLRHFFDVDELRLGFRLYLHEGLDLDAANNYWSALTAIPQDQFGKPYRAKPKETRMRSKHPLGCPAVRYHCAHTHRAVMGLVEALLSCDDCIPG